MKGFEGLLGNPMFQAGMGILSANAPSLTPPNYMGGAMKGLMRGAQYAQQQKEMEMKKKLYDIQLEEAEAKRAKEKQRLEVLSGFRKPDPNAPQMLKSSAAQLYTTGNPMADELMASGQTDLAYKLMELNKGDSPITVAEGASVVDPRTGREIFRNKPESSGGLWTVDSIKKEFDLGNYEPDSYELALKELNPSLLKEKKEKLTSQNILSEREKLYKKYEPLQTVSMSLRQLDRLTQSASPVRDVGAIYSVVKLFDPNSVVREGEIGLLTSANSIYENMKLTMQKAEEGGALTPKLRNDLRSMANDLAELYSEHQSKLRQKDEEFYSDFPSINLNTFMPVEAVFNKLEPIGGTGKGGQVNPENLEGQALLDFLLQEEQNSNSYIPSANSLTQPKLITTNPNNPRVNPLTGR